MIDCATYMSAWIKICVLLFCVALLEIRSCVRIRIRICIFTFRSLVDVVVAFVSVCAISIYVYVRARRCRRGCVCPDLYV
jgi:hypothetical protein